MKSYTKSIKLLVLSGLICLSSGCGEKFVDLIPQDVIPVGSFYKSEADIRAALTGAYGNLRGIYNSYFLYTEVPSDNTRTFGENEVGQGELDKFTYLPSSTNMSGAWNDAYRTISNCNVILDKISPVSFASTTTKDQYAGEAKFLRALMYFNLVRYFGDVPLVLKEITTEADAYSFTRSPVATVYAQIEKDLLEAEKVLPAKYTGANIGRATSGAAKSLLGKAYLQQKKWPEAEAKLAEVIASGTYRILPNITDVFGVGRDNNDEIVFAVQYVSGGFGEGNSYSANFAPQPSGTTIIGVTGNSFNTGTQDLFDAYEKGDVRRDAYMGIYGTPPNVYYWAKKFIYYVTLQNEGENDWPVLRYADVLLMYAEAANNNGKTDLALTQVNTIRKRAGLAEKTGLSRTDTQLAIEQERRVELAFEGHRWYDLIRWDKEVATMLAFKAKYTSNDPANANMSPSATKRLYPIPFRERTLNPSLTQNPGY
ncbi:RagB/SusD family nutrient uptake outer membrane protein [Spirosoma aerophilum]